jgi:hypothetical protein
MTGGHAGVTQVTHLLGGGHGGVTLRSHGEVTQVTIPMRTGFPPFRGGPAAGGGHEKKELAPLAGGT